VSATTVWVLVALVAASTAVIKGIGPFALGGRELPEWFNRVIALMAPALLAALVCTATLADGRELGVGADTAGVAVAGVLVWRGASVVVAVIVAAATTALLRAV
jgi:branched-subunit amino acid transport protein